MVCFQKNNFLEIKKLIIDYPAIKKKYRAVLATDLGGSPIAGGGRSVLYSKLAD